MNATEINTIWMRIKAFAGEEFRMIRGGTFRYRVHKCHVIPDRTNQQIPKSHFRKALSFLPLQDTVPIQHLRGPSLIYAILTDSRIRKKDW